MKHEKTLRQFNTMGQFRHVEKDGVLHVHWESYVPKPERQKLEKRYPDVRMTYNEVIRELGRIIPNEKT